MSGIREFICNDLMEKVWEEAELFRSGLGEADGIKTEGKEAVYVEYVNEPVKLLHEDEIGICVVGASNDRGVYLLVGNAVRVALFVRRYEEAGRIARKRPYLLDFPEYQELKLFRCLPDGSYTFEQMPNDWDLLFADKDMPDKVFAFFCRRFHMRTRAAASEKAERLDMPLSDQLINVELNWEKLSITPGCWPWPYSWMAEEDPVKRTLFGLRRMKKVVPKIWDDYYDTAIELNLVRRMTVSLFKRSELPGQQPVEHEDPSEEELTLIRDGLWELGCGKVVNPVDLIACGSSHLGEKLRWVGKFWKKIYQKECLELLVSDMDSISFYWPLLQGISQLGKHSDLPDTGDDPDIRNRVDEMWRKGLAELNGLKWDKKEEYSDTKDILNEFFSEEASELGTWDPCILLECIRKQIFPPFCYQRLLEILRKTAPDRIPLLILGRFS